MSAPRPSLTSPIFQTPSVRHGSRGYADFRIRRTLGVSFPLAVEAGHAGDVVKPHDPVAHREVADAAAGFCHHAGSFMAVDARRGQQIVLDLLQVGVADPA